MAGEPVREDVALEAEDQSKVLVTSMYKKEPLNCRILNWNLNKTRMMTTLTRLTLWRPEVQLLGQALQ